jgi:RNA polymerase sigma-70 factor (ECF subfamily)
VVDAFFAAAHSGDFAALVAVLDPDVVVRTDCATAFAELSGVSRGAEAVASQSLAVANPAAPKLPVLVNGAAGVVVMFEGQPFAVMGFTISDGKVVEINTILDPERVRRLDLSALD